MPQVAPASTVSISSKPLRMSTTGRATQVTPALLHYLVHRGSGSGCVSSNSSRGSTKTRILSRLLLRMLRLHLLILRGASTVLLLLSMSLLWAWMHSVMFDLVVYPPPPRPLFKLQLAQQAVPSPLPVRPARLLSQLSRFTQTLLRLDHCD